MKTYCLDTSFLINSWVRYYPISTFPNLWNTVDHHISEGTIASCEEVYKEIEAKEDDLFTWSKARKHLFHAPCDQTLLRLREVMKQFPNFAAVGGTLNRADPFIIAHAIQYDCVVVSDEASNPKSKSTKPPKIPDVCNAFRLTCLRPAQFLAELGYSDAAT